MRNNYRVEFIIENISFGKISQFRLKHTAVYDYLNLRTKISLAENITK